MSHLLDTDTCIYWLNGVEEVAQHVKRVGVGSLFISIITLAELKYGAYNSAHVNSNLERIEKFLLGVQVLNLSGDIVDKFGRVKAELRSRGQATPDFDLLIGCTALAYHFTLVTNNVRHFSRIPDLEIEDWRSP